jgi:hypothetical protein
VGKDRQAEARAVVSTSYTRELLLSSSLGVGSLPATQMSLQLLNECSASLWLAWAKIASETHALLFDDLYHKALVIIFVGRRISAGKSNVPAIIE